MTPILDGSDDGLPYYEESGDARMPDSRDHEEEFERLKDKYEELKAQEESENEQSELLYPTPWHLIDAELQVECRNVTMDTFELRSPTHTLKLNKEGFDLWRDNSLQGQVIFQEWMARNNLEAQPREPEVSDG